MEKGVTACLFVDLLVEALDARSERLATTDDERRTRGASASIARSLLLAFPQHLKTLSDPVHCQEEMGLPAS